MTYIDLLGSCVNGGRENGELSCETAKKITPESSMFVELNGGIFLVEAYCDQIFSSQITALTLPVLQLIIVKSYCDH